MAYLCDLHIPLLEGAGGGFKLDIQIFVYQLFIVLLIIHYGLMFYVYILYSKSRDRYCVGYSFSTGSLRLLVSPKSSSYLQEKLKLLNWLKPEIAIRKSPQIPF